MWFVKQRFITVHTLAPWPNTKQGVKVHVVSLTWGPFIFYQGGGGGDLVRSINIDQAQSAGGGGGEAGKKSSQERGAMFPTSLTMGWASFYTNRGRPDFFVRATKENAPPPPLPGQT